MSLLGIFFVGWIAVSAVAVFLDWSGNDMRGRFRPVGDRARGVRGRLERRRYRKLQREDLVRETLLVNYGRPTRTTRRAAKVESELQRRIAMAEAIAAINDVGVEPVVVPALEPASIEDPVPEVELEPAALAAVVPVLPDLDASDREPLPQPTVRLPRRRFVTLEPHEPPEPLWPELAPLFDELDLREARPERYQLRSVSDEQPPKKRFVTLRKREAEHSPIWPQLAEFLERADLSKSEPRQPDVRGGVLTALADRTTADDVEFADDDLDAEIVESSHDDSGRTKKALADLGERGAVNLGAAARGLGRIGRRLRDRRTTRGDGSPQTTNPESEPPTLSDTRAG